MYRIVQVLNNNVAIVRDEAQQQAIAMGKGIVFQKKKGDLISKDLVTNLFVLKNEESRENFSILLKDIPLDFITTTYEIIENAVTKYEYSVQDYIYVTLTDHIYWNYKRLMTKDYQDSLLPDISQQYPTEYQIAKDALKIIKNRLGIEFPNDELKNISIHFINAQAKSLEHNEKIVNPFLNKKEAMKLIEKLLREKKIIRTGETQNFYDRLMIHIRYMLERTEEYKKDVFAEKMENELKVGYPEAYSIAEEMYQIINDNTGQKLKASEKVYFTIHIQRLI